jgi:DNA-binding SARP family transcriptional activator
MRNCDNRSFPAATLLIMCRAAQGGRTLDTVDVALLGGFHCVHAGQYISLPLGAQRLVALLALQMDHAVHRTTAGERLWPDSTRERASANLRSALWRCRRVGGTTLIEDHGKRLQLAPAVIIDVHDVVRRVRDDSSGATGTPASTCESLVDRLGRDLLPDWSDDWLIIERERWDQLRLHALENLGRELLHREQYPAALHAALVAIAIEPTRETAHRLVIQVHLAEGNAATALKHYQRYRGLLSRELGVMPSERMNRLIRDLLPR